MTTKDTAPVTLETLTITELVQMKQNQEALVDLIKKLIAKKHMERGKL
jgi:predicted CopG family antitoxin